MWKLWVEEGCLGTPSATANSRAHLALCQIVGSSLCGMLKFKGKKVLGVSRSHTACFLPSGDDVLLLHQSTGIIGIAPKIQGLHFETFYGKPPDILFRDRLAFRFSKSIAEQSRRLRFELIPAAVGKVPCFGSTSPA